MNSRRRAGRLEPALTLALIASLLSGCLRFNELGTDPLFDGLQSLLIDRGTYYLSVSLTAPDECGATYAAGKTTVLGYKQDLDTLALPVGVEMSKGTDVMWGSRWIAPPDRILNVDGDRVDDVSPVARMPVEVAFPVLQAGFVVRATEAIPPRSSLISVASTSGGALIKGGAGAPGKLYTVTPRLAGTTTHEDPVAELFLASGDEAFHVIDGPRGLVWLKGSSDSLSLTVEGEEQLLSLHGSVTSTAIAHGRIALLEDLRTLLVLIFVETKSHYMIVDLKGGEPADDWKSPGVTIAADTGLAVVGFRAEEFLIVPRYGEVHSISDRGEFDPPTKLSGVLRAVSLGPQRSAVIRKLTGDKTKVEFSDDRPERVEFSDDRPKRQLDLTPNDIYGAYNYLGSLMIRTGDGLVMCSPEKCGYIVCVDGGGRSEVCGPESVQLQRRDMVPPPSGHSPAQDFAIGPFLVSIPSRVSPAGSRLPPVIGPRSFVDLDGRCYN